MVIFSERAVMDDQMVSPIGIGPRNCVSCGTYCLPGKSATLGDKLYCLACHAQAVERERVKVQAVERDGVKVQEFVREIIVDDVAKKLAVNDALDFSVPDMAPIGESEPTERDDSVNIPLPHQKRLLKATFYDTTLWLQELLEDDDFMQDLEKMAEARMEQSHPKWGSTMFAWDSPRRWRAIMEELADVFVYKSSEA